jgi:hypothetical protein
MDNIYPEYESLPEEDLLKIMEEINFNIDQTKMFLYEENMKFEKFKVKFFKYRLRIKGDNITIFL